MKSLLRGLLVGALLFALSGMVSGAEDVTGFKGFRWGTDFETVNQAKDLKWFQDNGEIGVHSSRTETEVDENGKPIVGYRYGFYDNKLVIGEIKFFDRSRYLKAVNLIEEKFGKPTTQWEKDVSVHYFDSTFIVCDSGENMIMFWSLKYSRDRTKRDEAAKKAKKDKEFDQLFN